ncbi:MAG TPA: J domain-containing protein [Pirellulales bacterium]
MDQHQLPPELDRWPDDPYALLGVTWTVAPRDLKRAYTRLIRSYKPEQFPEHFRRLREAYEIVLRHVEFRQATGQDDAADGQMVVRFDTQRTPVADASGSPVPAESRQPPSGGDATWTETLEGLWEFACSGQESVAYERLRALFDRHPGHPDLCCRLYWLLALSPELDPARTPEDWLAEGMMSGGLAGPLGELYRRELVLNPDEATGDRATRLLDAPASAGVLASFVEARWRAAALTADASPTVAEDLQRLRPRIEREDHDVWIGLLLTAIEHLLWSENVVLRQIANEFKAEVEEDIHSHRRMDAALDRLEMSSEIAAVWQKPGLNLPDELVAVVRQSRVQEFAELRPRLEAYFTQALVRPIVLFKQLDAVASQSSVAISALHEPLAWWHSMVGPISDQRSEEQLSTLVCEFLKRSDFFDYRAFRPKLLEFCLHESLTAEQFEQSLSGCGLLGLADLAAAIHRDLALRFVAHAYRVFWA